MTRPRTLQSPPLPSKRMARLADPYRRAAVGYVIYGLVYLGGAVIELSPERQRDFFGFVPWWVFYIAGLGLVLTIPVVVWQRRMWFTRVLSVFPVIKALSLLLGLGKLLGEGEPTSLYRWFFSAVAMVAGVLLARAGWGTQLSSED
jgi:hypothetical protein